METKKLSKKAAILSGETFTIKDETLLEYRTETDTETGSVFLYKRYAHNQTTERPFNWDLLGIAKVTNGGISVRSWSNGFLTTGFIKNNLITIK